MDSAVLIGLDISTHSAKAIAWSTDGHILGEGREAYTLQISPGGHYEQDACEWTSASLAALEALPPETKKRTKAIAVTHQRETVVPIGKNGSPLRKAIVWMDERALAQVQALNDSVGASRFHAITGKPLSITPSISKILWVHEHEPRVLDELEAWLDVSSFVILALTGHCRTSTACVDPMGLVDLSTQDYSVELLKRCGLTRANLPALAAPGSIVGKLRDELAKKLGFPSDIPIVATAGDGQVAALGAGVFGLDHAYMNLGTAVVAGAVSDTMVRSTAFRTMLGACPSTFLLESDLKGGTLAIDWFTSRVLEDACDLEELDERAQMLPAGSDGLVHLPYLAGVMNPYWNDLATGVFVGLRASQGPAHMYRAIMEGISMEQRLSLDAIGEASGTRIDTVHLLGGGAQSRLWCQILADSTGREIYRMHSPESTSLGAAMLAASAVGIYDSPRTAAAMMSRRTKLFVPSEQSKIYDDLYENVYRKLYPSLRETMNELSRVARTA